MSSSTTDIRDGAREVIAPESQFVGDGIVVLSRRTVPAEDAVAVMPPAFVPGTAPPWAAEIVAPRCLPRAVSGLLRAVDISVSLVLLLLLGLPALILAFLASRESADPVFFGSTRLGRGLRPFEFRQMRMPRRGRRLGAALRIDRVPSLLNVLAGDMSLVGPVPEKPEAFGGHELWHCLKWHVKPGVTGYAQIICRERAEGVGAEETAYLDVRYVLDRSVSSYLRALAGDARTAVSRAPTRARCR